MPRRRLTWPAEAPRVGIHLSVQKGLVRAARRARQIGATALQIFGDNPTAWRRRPEPPADAAQFVAFCQAESIQPIAIHASYLINLAGTAEPFASQSRDGIIHELRSALAYGARYVNVHAGSHRGAGSAAGLRQVAETVAAALAEAPHGVRLVLENSSGGGGAVGSTVEELAAILDAVAAATGGDAGGLAFCLDTAHLWGVGYDVSTTEGATAVIDRFDEVIGLDRLPLMHLNDSRSARGSRGDRHEHLGAGRIGPEGLAAFLRDPRLARGTTLVMETPGVDEGYDAVNMRRGWLLYKGGLELPTLPAGAFRLGRASTRTGPGRPARRGRAPRQRSVSGG